MTSVRSFELFVTVTAIVVCVCAFTATGIVLFGHVPPVFNESLKAIFAMNIAFLAILALVIGVLIASFFHSKIAGLRRPVLVAITAVATLELLLFAFDKTVISVKGSVLHTADYTIRVNDGAIFLAQPNPQSPFGFRSPRVEPKDSDGHRILFLGSSYVAGSGKTFSTNYPQAFENDLNRLLPNRAETVFSAGVVAYGVVEDRLLYEYLTQKGYRFDTVVLNFVLGSDTINDIPGTTRTAIIGEPQRLHKNLFLRYFYPLNSYLSRFAVYLKITNQKWGPEETSALKDATCRQSPGFAAFNIEQTKLNYAPEAQKHLDMDFKIEQIDALARDVQKNGARFMVILLPDQKAVLPVNRDRFHGTEMNWDWTRQYMSNKLAGKYPLLDLSSFFQNRPDLFACDDTHWNDAGNLYAADVVANYFAKDIAGSDAIDVARAKTPQYTNFRTRDDPFSVRTHPRSDDNALQRRNPR
jgi:hypothetical protein